MLIAPPSRAGWPSAFYATFRSDLVLMFVREDAQRLPAGARVGNPRGLVPIWGSSRKTHGARLRNLG